MLHILDGYDWDEAFSVACEDIRPAIPKSDCDLSSFSRDDVVEIWGISEGDNDGPPWLVYGRLKDGRCFFLEAGCDYTGWDCQAGGSAVIGQTRSEVERYGLGDDDRKRLGVALEANA